MSVRTMAFIWEHSPHKGTALLMLLAIGDHSNDQGVCWPSVARLAARCRINKRQAVRVIHYLEQAGSISIERGGGRGHASTYMVKGVSEYTFCRKDVSQDTLSDIKGAPQDTLSGEKVSCGAPFQKQEKVSSMAQKVSSRAIKGVLDGTPTIIEPSEEPSEENDPPLVPPEGETGETGRTDLGVVRKRRKTYYPDTPAQQTRLRESILDQDMHAWAITKGIVLNLSDQWERFSAKALARGYAYVNWRVAFQNWLTSDYQQTTTPIARKTHAQREAELQAWVRKMEEEQTHHATM